MKVRIGAKGRGKSIDESVGHIAMRAETEREIAFLTALTAIHLDGGTIKLLYKDERPDFIYSLGGCVDLPRPEPVKKPQPPFKKRKTPK
jgi:hypothetical protein